MYGLPSTSPLGRTVIELCKDHLRRAEMEEGVVYGTEPGLLAMLEDAVGNSSGTSTGGGSAQHTRTPADLQALQMLEGIRATVAQCWPGAGTPATRTVPLIQQLEEWTTSVVGNIEHEVLLHNFANMWHNAIREHFEPSKHVPLRGVMCPKCKTAYKGTINGDGEQAYSPALMAHLSEYPVRAECLECATEWHGGELLDLQAASVAAAW